MKTVIRPQAFETNSSSEHALVWSKNYDMSRSFDIHFIPAGGFFWGYEVYTEPVDKISYLYAAVGGIYRSNPIAIEAWKERMVEILNLPDDVVFECSDNPYYPTGDVDHSECLNNLISSLETDDELLRSFVYGEGQIECGDDNDGWPENHWIESEEFEGRWDSERNTWIDSQYPWEEVVNYNGNWLYLKGN